MRLIYDRQVLALIRKHWLTALRRGHGDSCNLSRIQICISFDKHCDCERVSEESRPISERRPHHHGFTSSLAGRRTLRIPEYEIRCATCRMLRALGRREASAMATAALGV
ncbi:hypothetical protein B0H17DRAFT_1051395, partial [Mycena rosella]